MIPDFTWRHGDQEPIFAQLLTYSDGSPVNLDGCTLAIIIRSLAASAPVTVAGAVVAVLPADSTIANQIQWTPSSQDSATIQPGIYLGNWTVTFPDGTPMTFPTDGFLWIEVEESLATIGSLTVGIRPSVTDVAGLLRARTKVQGGKEIGTFIDGQTRPTGTEVNGLIDDAIDEVLGKIIGIDAMLQPGSAYNAPGSAYERRVRGAVRLYTAILIESSYFPEQTASGRSPIQTYQQLYDSRIRALISEDKTGRPEGMGDGKGGSGSGGASPPDAAWSFPQNAGGLVGWGTRW